MYESSIKVPLIVFLENLIPEIPSPVDMAVLSRLTSVLEVSVTPTSFKDTTDSIRRPFCLPQQLAYRAVLAHLA